MTIFSSNILHLFFLLTEFYDLMGETLNVNAFEIIKVVDKFDRSHFTVKGSCCHAIDFEKHF